MLALSEEDRNKWVAALQKPEGTEVTLNLLNEITKESLYEDINRAGYVKRDLMKVANLIVNDIPRKKNHKQEKNEKSEENKEINPIYEAKASNEEDSEGETNKGFCSSCLAFLKRKKKNNSSREPLLIN